jgi:hypothetical protein
LSREGSVGTEGNKPAGFYGSDSSHNASGGVGLAYDQDGFGTGKDSRVDVVLPDAPEERWAVGYDGAPEGNFSALSGSGGGTLTNTSLTDTSAGTTLSGASTGTINDTLKVKQAVSFGVNDSIYKTTVTLTNTGHSTLHGVQYMRSFDPDNTVDFNGSNITTNTIGGQYATDKYDLVTATSLPGDGYNDLTGKQVTAFYYSTDSRASVYTGGFSNTNPYDYSDLNQPTAYAQNADSAIGIVFKGGDLAPGKSVTFTYYAGVTTDSRPASIRKLIGGSSGAGGGNSSGGFGALLESGVSTLTSLASTYADVIGASTKVEYLGVAKDAYDVGTHFSGYLKGDPVDATHVALETTSLIFGVASIVTAPAPPISIGLSLIGAGFGVADFFAGAIFGR